MAELPERKVLKKVLTNLKSRTITSEEELKATQKECLDEISFYYGKLKVFSEESRGKKTKVSISETTDIVADMILHIGTLVRRLVKSIHRSFEDMKIYTKTLEDYSLELDKTLNQIFEQAKKQAEEQITKQSELMKRRDKSYTV